MNKWKSVDDVPVCGVYKTLIIILRGVTQKNKTKKKKRIDYD